MGGWQGRGLGREKICKTCSALISLNVLYPNPQHRKE